MFSRTERCMQEALDAVAGHVHEPCADRVRRVAEARRRAPSTASVAAGRAPRARRGPRRARPGPGPRAPRRRAPRPACSSNETSAACVSGAQVADREARRPGSCPGDVAAAWPRERGVLARGARLAPRARPRLGPSMSSTIRSSAPGAMSTTPTVSPSRSTVARSHSARDLEEAVRDEDDRPTGLALSPTTSSTLLGQVGRQRRGHLVEQQDVWLGRQRPREVHDAQRSASGSPEPSCARSTSGHAELGQPADGTASTGVSRQAQVLKRRRGPGSSARLLVDGHEARCAAPRPGSGPRVPGPGRRMRAARRGARRP